MSRLAILMALLICPLTFASCSDDYMEPDFSPVPPSNSNSLAVPKKPAFGDYLEEFCEDWETYQSVKLYVGDKDNPQDVALPWADVVTTTIPSSMRGDVKKADGWEMAFSTLGDPRNRDLNYFGLYNRYSGVLRVFLYVSDATTTASNYNLDMNLGSEYHYDKYPFYHSLAYSIPTHHKNIDYSANPASTRYPFTFNVQVSPYFHTQSPALKPGWTMFEIPASGYYPGNSKWPADGNEDIMMSINTTLEQSISMIGDIKAGISGEFTSPTSVYTSTKGVSSPFQDFMSSGGSAGKTLIKDVVTAVANGDPFSKALKVGLAVFDFTSSFIGNDANKAVEQPGKVDMNLTGSIDLNGYIKSASANQVKSVTFKGSYLNPESNFGKGIWNLDEDPVVYVCADRVIGKPKRFRATVKGGGVYGGSEEFHLDSLRYVSFLDPTSIKLDIREDIYPNITDLKVKTAVVGVYPDLPAGHTDPYLNLLQFQRGKFSLSDATSGIYSSTDPNAKVKYFSMKNSETFSDELQENNSTCRFVPQAGSDYGYLGNPEVVCGRKFIIDPQVLLPVTKDDPATFLHDGPCPDFVVVVAISFKSEGRTYTFTSRFIPNVQYITANAARNKLDALKAYRKQVNAGQYVNQVVGSYTPVYHEKGAATVERAIKLLERLYK